MPYERLFSPFTLGRLQLRNRIAMLPYGTAMVRDGIPTVVRQRETTEEVRRLERLPDHLVSAETAASTVAPRATPGERRGGAGGD